MEYIVGRFTVSESYGEPATSTVQEVISRKGEPFGTISVRVPVVPDDEFASIKTTINSLCNQYESRLYKNNVSTGLKSAIEQVLPGIFDSTVILPDYNQLSDSGAKPNSKLLSVFPNVLRAPVYIRHEDGGTYVFEQGNKYMVTGLYNYTWGNTDDYINNERHRFCIYPLFTIGYAGRTFLLVINESCTSGFALLVEGSSYTFPTDSSKEVLCRIFSYNINPLENDTWLPMFGAAPDPYAPGGESGPGGGDGTFDFSSQPIEFQDAPLIGAYDTGMISIYVPTAEDLQSLSAYLWAGTFDINNFKKIMADPMDAIIGLSILPVTDTQIGTSMATLDVGNISTGISMPKANKQYVVVDCGTVNILPKWGSYLDFSPYSKLQLFLPYIGYVDISPDDCMNTSISVRYTIDILSGTCVVQVKCADHVLYEFSGMCSCSCPVTAGQYQNIVISALKLGGSIASAAAAADAGSIRGAISGALGAGSAIQESFKPAISRSGGFGGSSGLMGHQYPYLILTIPRMCLPGKQDKMIGYPSFVTKNLGQLNGYCVVDTIHLAGVPASEEEQSEIVELLKGGVYL